MSADQTIRRLESELAVAKLTEAHVAAKAGGDEKKVAKSADALRAAREKHRTDFPAEAAAQPDTLKMKASR